MHIHTQHYSLYHRLWKDHPSYADHSPGEHHVRTFVQCLQRKGYPHSGRILDAGAGSGKGSLALARLGFDVTVMDLTDAGLVDDAKSLEFVKGNIWEASYLELGRFSYVYCCDVLEHIPTEFTMLAVSRLTSLSEVACFLTIGLRADTFGPLVGQPLHLTVRPFQWWLERLTEFGDIDIALDAGNSGLFLVRTQR